MKHEWRKKEKALYVPKEKPALINVPQQKFLLLKGIGNPNSELFAEKIGILYSVSYSIRMMPKRGITPEGYFEYTVYPLEGIWDLTEEGRQDQILNKDQLVYKIMIRQPDFVTEEIVDTAIQHVREKKPNPLLDEVIFGSIEDGLSVQMLHVGSYDEEARTFNKMEAFLEDNDLQRASLVHREIYLSDFRKVEPAKLKTVLRYKVQNKDEEE